MNRAVSILGFFLVAPAIATSAADSYDLVMSKDDKVCVHLHRLLSDALEKSGGDVKKFTNLGRYRGALPGFDAVTWARGKYTLVAVDGSRHERLVDVAHFDIDNDGYSNQVIRESRSYRSTETQHIDMHDVLSFYFLDPLRLGATYYVSLNEQILGLDGGEPDSTWPSWHVIAEYTDQMLPLGPGSSAVTNKLEHVCYFNKRIESRSRKR